MEERLSAAGGELAATIRAGVATVTLDRPAALNALTLPMLEGVAGWLESWRHDERVRTVVLRGAGDRAFCAGGDIRALHAGLLARDARTSDFFRIEYALDYAIYRYPKPVVALLDGIVMGGGMGLAQGASLRIVGPRTKMAMPETAIGLFPDVGGSWFLSKLPRPLGRYVALLGPTLSAADAIYCGLADLDLGPAQPSALEAQRADIDRHFGAESVPAIVASLERDGGEWAAKALASLARRSPTALAVTFEQLERGGRLSLAECFRMEYAMIHRAFEQGDLLEGIRALLVDKDNAPRWNPATLAAVGQEDVDSYFKPRWQAAEHPLASLT